MLILGGSILLILVLIGGYFWLLKTGMISQLNLSALLAGLTQRKAVVGPNEAITSDSLSITLPSTVSQAGVYEEVAERGEGITHLARKALKRYLEKTQVSTELTKEHKIYIEDYLQKKTGDRLLQLGEKVSFSEEMIKEAISKAQQLTPQQLENLKQYSALVYNL